MKVAVVHGLLRGGAVRRLAGTVQPWSTDPSVEMREFALSGTVVIDPSAREEAAWESRAVRRHRVLRPALRYRDSRSVRSTWAALLTAVDAWTPDVVFANPCASPGGAPPGLERLRAPVLYYCDEPRRLDYEPAAQRETNPWTRVLYAPMRISERRAERRSVRGVQRVLTNSAFTAGRIKGAYGVDATVSAPGISTAFTTGRSAQVTHVLSVGTLLPSKGHDLAIVAVAEAGLRLPLVVVAPRRDREEEGRLRRLGAQVGVDVEVRVGITDDELVGLYRSAIATVYLAREEPLGLVSLESQACGTPVVVADEGGLAGTVVDGVTGYVVRRDATAAAEALGRLADPSTRRRVRQALTRAHVTREAEVADQVLAALMELASS